MRVTTKSYKDFKRLAKQILVNYHMAGVTENNYGDVFLDQLIDRRGGVPSRSHCNRLYGVRKHGAAYQM
jgi:hypothetical protein